MALVFVDDNGVAHAFQRDVPGVMLSEEARADVPAGDSHDFRRIFVPTATMSMAPEQYECDTLATRAVYHGFVDWLREREALDSASSNHTVVVPAAACRARH
ncbi:hypothetical protein DIPPA_16496 [Diplonema papillatum]|nr:hypothetical protein DIPPA_16496 [Diplonema papillatum]